MQECATRDEVQYLGNCVGHKADKANGEKVYRNLHLLTTHDQKTGRNKDGIPTAENPPYQLHILHNRNCNRPLLVDTDVALRPVHKYKVHASLIKVWCHQMRGPCH